MPKDSSVNNAEKAAENFRIWSQKKAVRDKALELIPQFSSTRIDDPDKFKEFAISLCAVDKLLEDSSGDDDPNNISSAKEPKKDLSIKSVWVKWTIDNKYKFDRIKLSDSEYKDFSGATKV